MKVAVFGARGRMGAEVCRALEAAGGLQLVAALRPRRRPAAAEVANVAIDFTHPDAVMENLAWCIDHGSRRGRDHRFLVGGRRQSTGRAR